MPFCPELISVDSRWIVTPAVAAIVGLGFNESAYLAEIFKAGHRHVAGKDLDSNPRPSGANRTYLPVPLLLVAASWYLAITSVLMVGQSYLERHFGRGHDVIVVKGGPK